MVFLGEARPVFLRLHVRLDGKPIQTGWDGVIKYLFDYLDVNRDGVLSKEEAERAPTRELLLGGLLGRGRGGVGGGAGSISLADLDTDKDGKVTLAELSAYYRKKGFEPFQVQVTADQTDPLAQFAAFTGRQATPSAAAVSEAIFALLDVNKDGKLSKEELAAAPTVLLRMDEDEDEIVTNRELTPNFRPAGGFGRMAGMMGPRRDRLGTTRPWWCSPAQAKPQPTWPGAFRNAMGPSPTSRKRRSSTARNWAWTR